MLFLVSQLCETNNLLDFRLIRPACQAPGGMNSRIDGRRVYWYAQAMEKLTGSQKKKLRGLAHHLEPVVLVGRQGLTPALLKSVDQALEIHELIKIKFNDFKEIKKDISEGICRELGAELAGIIGHVAVVYRPATDASRRTIRL